MRAHSCVATLLLVAAISAAEELPLNRWVEARKDSAGARPGSAIRYVPESHAFFLWGYMNDDPELLQEQPLMQIHEYDMQINDLQMSPDRTYFITAGKDKTAKVCTWTVTSSLPKGTSHSFIVPSPLTETSVLPSGENATE